MKVNYQDQFYDYPDAFVTGDPRDRDDRYIKRYPKLIAEVLSPSTQIFDLGAKFDDYQQLESLEEYVLISQENQRVECRRRTTANTWETVVYEAGDRVVLKSISLEFAIAALYRGLMARASVNKSTGLGLRSISQSGNDMEIMNVRIVPPLPPVPDISVLSSLNVNIK